MILITARNLRSWGSKPMFYTCVSAVPLFKTDHQLRSASQSVTRTLLNDPFLQSGLWIFLSDQWSTICRVISGFRSNIVAMILDWMWWVWSWWYCSYRARTPHWEIELSTLVSARVAIKLLYLTSWLWFEFHQTNLQGDNPWHRVQSLG